MIKIYGPVGSSARRCYWALEEIGVEWKAAPFSFRDRDHKSPEFLALNPNGKVPVLVDGDTVLWESVAINGYLAAKYAPKLLGETLEEQAHVAKWGLWSQIEYQKPLIALFIQKLFVPEERRDQELIAKSSEGAADLNALVDGHLAKRNYFVGERFTLADLHVASVARLNGLLEIPLDDFPNLDRWLGAMQDRPAHQRVAALETN